MYEGYAAGGVAVLLELMTDNKNRTAAEIRHLFSRHNGSLGESGCVSWMFTRKGLITVNREGLDMDEDDLLLLALEAGAEDVRNEDENTYSIIADIDSFESVKEELQNQGVSIESFEITMIPSSSIEITEPEMASKIIKLMEALDDHDDVQNVYANFEMPDELLD